MIAGDVTPAEPVSFSVNGVPGVSVSQVVVGGYAGLDGRDDGISSFEKKKAICRIQVGTTAVRTRLSSMPFIVHWVFSVHIHGKKPSPRPVFLLLNRLPDEHST